MAVILGIDIGTSSVKAMLFDTEEGPLAVRAKEYGVTIPHPGFAEQDPELWWASLKEALSGLQAERPDAYQAVAAVGYSGQMHGLVLVDEAGNPVRPAIIWLGLRSAGFAKGRLRQICPDGRSGLRAGSGAFCGL